MKTNIYRNYLQNGKTLLCWRKEYEKNKEIKERNLKKVKKH